jgi:hypothetical protein
MLEVFHHGLIRGILGISRQRVRDERITNLEVRTQFFEHANIDESSEEDGPEVYWKGGPGRERNIITQVCQIQPCI